MLTERQLDEAAYRLVLEQLGQIAAGGCGERIGEILCERFCNTNQCGHDIQESRQEMLAVSAEVARIASLLKTKVLDEAGHVYGGDMVEALT